RVELCLRTLRIVEELGADFTRCGKLLLGHDEAEIEAFRATRHPEASVLAPEEIAAVAPELQLDGSAGARDAPGAAYVEPVLRRAPPPPGRPPVRGARRSRRSRRVPRDD